MHSFSELFILHLSNIFACDDKVIEEHYTVFRAEGDSKDTCEGARDTLQPALRV
jgi:hypothetical protein